jgi:hypothetical protein
LPDLCNTETGTSDPAGRAIPLVPPLQTHDVEGGTR